jgi:cytochrome c oxidase subunit 1
MFAAVYYWISPILGVMYDEVLGQIHFWVTFIGVNLTFFPMHFLGAAGMPRRIPDYPDVYWFWNYVASIGSFITFGGLFVFFYMLYKAFSQPTTLSETSSEAEVEDILVRSLPLSVDVPAALSKLKR